MLLKSMPRCGSFEDVSCGDDGTSGAILCSLALFVKISSWVIPNCTKESSCLCFVDQEARLK